MSVFDVGMMYGESGTILRRYLGSLDVNNDSVYVWGGGTYSVTTESFRVDPIRLARGLAELSASRYNPQDCVGAFQSNSVIAEGDRVVTVNGTFEVDKLRKYMQQGVSQGFEAYLKAM